MLVTEYLKLSYVFLPPIEVSEPRYQNLFADPKSAILDKTWHRKATITEISDCVSKVNITQTAAKIAVNNRSNRRQLILRVKPINGEVPSQ